MHIYPIDPTVLLKRAYKVIFIVFFSPRLSHPLPQSTVSSRIFSGRLENGVCTLYRVVFRTRFLPIRNAGASFHLFLRNGDKTVGNVLIPLTPGDTPPFRFVLLPVRQGYNIIYRVDDKYRTVFAVRFGVPDGIVSPPRVS